MCRDSLSLGLLPKPLDNLNWKAELCPLSILIVLVFGPLIV